MTSIAVDTPTMRELAQRVQLALTAISELDGAWCALESCGTRFSGHVHPVADALRELTGALGDGMRGSRDDLARLRDAILAVADAWDATERFTGTDGQAE